MDEPLDLQHIAQNLNTFYDVKKFVLPNGICLDAQGPVDIMTLAEWLKKSRFCFWEADDIANHWETLPTHRPHSQGLTSNQEAVQNGWPHRHNSQHLLAPQHSLCQPDLSDHDSDVELDQQPLKPQHSLQPDLSDHDSDVELYAPIDTPTRPKLTKASAAARVEPTNSSERPMRPPSNTHPFTPGTAPEKQSEEKQTRKKKEKKITPESGEKHHRKDQKKKKKVSAGDVEPVEPVVAPAKSKSKKKKAPPPDDKPMRPSEAKLSILSQKRLGLEVDNEGDKVESNPPAKKKLVFSVVMEMSVSPFSGAAKILWPWNPRHLLATALG